MSGGNKFNDFPENQITKFHAEFSNFMQNLEALNNQRLCNCVSLFCDIKDNQID